MRLKTVTIAATGLAAIVGTLVPLGAIAHADDPFGLGLPVPESADEIPAPVRAATGTFDGGEIILSPENNHLNAYSVATGERYRVITSAHEDVGSGRDINGQICVDPDPAAAGRRFVAGEDTGQGTSVSSAGVAGWGFFELIDDDGVVGDDPQAGDLLAGTADGLGATQIGKLAPAYGGAPDNHGCGFLSAANDYAMLTVTIGDILPGDPANGEVILWARDAERGFGWDFTTTGRDGLQSNTPHGETPYCKLALDIPTAGGMWVGDDDTIYVAANRPTGDETGNPLGGTPGGVYRISVSDFPTFDGSDWTGCHATTINDTAQAGLEVTEYVIDAERITIDQVPLQGYVPLGFAEVNPTAATPSGVVGSGHGTIYVSSVFTHTIFEYALDGTLVRPILLPGEGAVVDGAITPFGMVVDAAGDLWVADLGQAAVDVIPLSGSLVRIPITHVDGDTYVAGLPQAVDRGLTYPDGLGVTDVSFD